MKRNRWTEQTICEQIKTLHRDGQDISYASVNKSNPKLVGAATVYFGSYTKAVAAAGIDYGPFAKQKSWTDQSIIKELRLLKARNADLSHKSMARTHPLLLAAARHHFDTYELALEAADIDYTQILKMKRWTKRSIIQQLKALHRWGNDISYQALSQRHARLYNAARGHFGSYGEALTAAGIDPTTVFKKQTWTNQRIIKELKDMHRRGEDLSYRAMKRKNMPLTAATRLHFGSYAKALERAGLDYSKVRKVRHWDKEIIVQELRRLHASGQNLSSGAIRKQHNALRLAAKLHFGSYESALRVAGIDYDEIRRTRPWTKETIVAAIVEEHNKGNDINMIAMTKRNSGLVGAARTHFGSYGQAVAAAGIDYETIRKYAFWDKATIVRQLQDLRNQGKDIRPIAIRQYNGALAGAAKLHFGSYRKAVEAAGFEYRKPKPKRIKLTGVKPTRDAIKQKILDTILTEYQADMDISMSNMEKLNRSLLDRARVYFGSYRRAVELAGLNYDEILKYDSWTDAKILDRLREMDQKGEDLRSVHTRTVCGPLHGACKHHFGSYRKAIEAAGLEYPPKLPLPFWSRPKVLQTLRELHDQGIDLRYDRFKETHQPLFAAAKYYYRKYHRAVEAAGINYGEMAAAQVATKLVARKLDSDRPR